MSQEQSLEERQRKRNSRDTVKEKRKGKGITNLQMKKSVAIITKLIAYRLHREEMAV